MFRAVLGSSLLALLLAAGVAKADVAELPAPLRDVKPALQPVGAATLHWFGLHVYDIALYAQDAAYTTNSTAVLSIRYNISIKHQRLLNTTFKEWVRLGKGDSAQREQWIKQLDPLWPDLKPGDMLAAFTRQDGPTQFYFGDRVLGEVPDPAFGPAFFAIWLDENSRYPNVRRGFWESIRGKDGERMRNFLCLISAGLVCGGCASVSPRQYEKEQPVLDLSRYLDGPLEAWGMFQDRKGTVVKRFHVKMLGTWSNEVGRLEEDFEYTDGTTQRRVWTITKLDANRYTGTAGDVVGVAQGEAFGNALNWRYTLALPVGKKVYNVKFDDWMFLMDDEVMLNRATMSKWGFRLGEVTLGFRKLSNEK